MANKTINEIDNTVTSVASGDYLPIWDISAGKTGKITRGNLVSGLQSTLTFDNYPTKNSSNPVKSSGVFATNAVLMTSSKTITSAPTISSGSIIRVMFTSSITGSDTTTALSLSYNGTSYPVKVGKQGSLSNFVASYVNSAYTYLQAYTTLELAFDGTQFIIIGNPVVLSSSDYTIYADGLKQANTPFNQTFNSIATTFGYTAGDSVAFSDFVSNVIDLYGEGVMWIDNLWGDIKSFTLNFTDTTTTIRTSGVKIFGQFKDYSATNQWCYLDFIAFNFENVYLLQLHRDPSAITTNLIQIV